MRPPPRSPSRRASPLAIAVLLCVACATAPAPAPVAVEPPAAEPAAPAAATVIQAEYVPAARVEKERPPPSRRKRDYVLSEKQYRQLGRRYGRGFQPDDCRSLCQQDEAFTRSDDGKWTWVLRCMLGRSLRDEPVVRCREDALDDAQLARIPRR